MIEIKNEKIEPLPENMTQRYKEMYRLQATLTKDSECKSVEVDIHFFDGDDRKIRSIRTKGVDQEGHTIICFKNYYRNGQLSEGGVMKDGQYQEPHVFFNEDGTPQANFVSKEIQKRLQKGM